MNCNPHRTPELDIGIINHIRSKNTLHQFLYYYYYCTWYRTLQNVTQTQKCVLHQKKKQQLRKQVRLRVFRKCCRTNCQIPQFNRQRIPTAGTSNSKGSQTPIRPVARHNKIPTNGGSQSRPTMQKLLNPKCKKQQGKPERDLQDTWTLACRLYIGHVVGKEANAYYEYYDLIKFTLEFYPPMGSLYTEQ